MRERQWSKLATAIMSKPLQSIKYTSNISIFVLSFVLLVLESRGRFWTLITFKDGKCLNQFVLPKIYYLCSSDVSWLNICARINWLFCGSIVCFLSN